MTIDQMQPGDLPAVHALLQVCRLPVEGLDAHLATALVARDNHRVVGSAALELYPPFALLRSVAVAPDARGQGVGQLLTADAIALARRYRVQRLYLLTETAAAFFPKLGFATIPRRDVPPQVRHSTQFSTLCCASAPAMALDLTAPGQGDSRPEMT